VNRCRNGGGGGGIDRESRWKWGKHGKGSEVERLDEGGYGIEEERMVGGGSGIELERGGIRNRGGKGGTWIGNRGGKAGWGGGG
jgi:hypothetical protein